jgi:hypothetical protein
MRVVSFTFLGWIVFKNKFFKWHRLYDGQVRAESAVDSFVSVGASLIGDWKSNLDFKISISVSCTNYSIRSIFLGLFPIVCFIHSLHQVFILPIHMRSCQWIKFLRIVTHCIMNLLRPTFSFHRVDFNGWRVKLPLSYNFTRDKT